LEGRREEREGGKEAKIDLGVNGTRDPETTGSLFSVFSGSENLREYSMKALIVKFVKNNRRNKEK